MPVRDLLMSAIGAGSPPVWVDDVFSTYLYAGTGATQSINNGIDLADNGGMVWFKSRTNFYYPTIIDTIRGLNQYLNTNTNSAQGPCAGDINSFNNNGFTLNVPTSSNQFNNGSQNYASWTFRKQPKFFDVVQYTGNGSVRNIAHSLGSTPGMMIVKDTSNTANWAVYHKGLNGGTNAQNYYAVLNTTDAQVANSAWWNNTAPTSTQFTVGTDTTVNASGQTYIAYIFADQAGGFGTTGTDSAIACNYFTTDGSGNATVNLGWEPQYILAKRADGIGNWYVLDVMKGWSQTFFNTLYSNNPTAEATISGNYWYPTATGFNVTWSGYGPSSANYIYIAIRRPNKPPTTGTSVFSPTVATPTSAGNTVTTGFPVDLTMSDQLSGAFNYGNMALDRLRGDTTTSYALLQTDGPSAELSGTGGGLGFDNNTGYVDLFNYYWGIRTPNTYWNFRRAPTFFDEVCYTGTGSATTQTHNLGVVPELMIVKCRSAINDWWVYHSTTGNTKYSVLNSTAIPTTSSTAWNNTTPTSSVFSIGTGAPVNTSAATYVAYLFATCAGVSKVGSYTGNGTGQSIACGFGSGGARFILIKRTDSTSDWYCFDSANGLTSSSSPYLLWDSTAAQVTGNNGVYASSGGFTLGATALLTTNIATATYIFLAIS